MHFSMVPQIAAGIDILFFPTTTDSKFLVKPVNIRRVIATHTHKHSSLRIERKAKQEKKS